MSGEPPLLCALELPLLGRDFALEAVASPLSGACPNARWGAIEVNGRRWYLDHSAADDLWWVNPRPEAAFYDGLYRRYFYASPLEEQLGYATLELDGARRAGKATLNWDDIEEHVRLDDRASVLELGCATGEFLLEARRRGFAHCAGVEVDDAVVARARAHAGLVIHQGFFEQLNFGAPRYRLVFADNVIEHVFDPVADVRRINGLQEVGDRLVLRLPETEPGGPTLKLIDHTFHFTRRSIATLLALGGYDAETIFYSGSYFGAGYDPAGHPERKIINMTVIGTKARDVAPAAAPTDTARS